jgi:hypothetical protein
MYITAPEPISTAYFINPYQESARVCVCVFPIAARQRLGKNPPIVARQQLSKNVTAATNTHSTELLEGLFSVRSVSYHGE